MLMQARLECEFDDLASDFHDPMLVHLDPMNKGDFEHVEFTVHALSL